MGKHMSKSVANVEGLSKEEFLSDFMSSLHEMTAEELAAERNPNYQYII